jgi:nicotinate-nucleotide--dimethylbenzimidazole phosphoribosyltransferase
VGLIPTIQAGDEAAGSEARARLDVKTKPRGSLGELEDLVARIAAARGTPDLRPLEAAIVVVAGDHGYAREHVSAYPQAVTGQMLANFAAGGAAINVLARRLGLQLVVADAGVVDPFDHPAVRSLRLGAGTGNATRGPAMSVARAEEGIAAGIALAEELGSEGIEIVGLGEMGIGNTTAASALTAALLRCDPESVCGRGTGIDDDTLDRKIDVLRRALAANEGALGDPVSTLAALGGFEHTVLAGLCLGTAARNGIVLLDGFVSSAAALVAFRIAPPTAERMVASHLSPEPGHRAILEELGLRPLLDLGLRLGEGTGAALAVPIVNAALALMEEMATFAEAGVSDR